jgi:serine/threonine-protein kinase
MRGLLFGHYRIIEELGEGGTSTVYRACDTKENREVSLKCLNQKANKDESLRLLFQEEFKRLSEIRHPNFPTAFDIGGLSNCPFFAMELIS